MSSVLKKITRSKNNAREFQITASVSALTLECSWKEFWHPHKIVILWDKNDRSCYTKPIPWQPGVKNPFRGIHVWPEPDPVKITSTLYKNPKREGTYEDHPWDFVIKNESRSGRRKVIATGSIDLADYISESRKTFDVTVTLKPANKNIISGSMEFSLMSVMLVDGIPHRTREELVSEILHEAMNAASAANEKATKPYASEGAENFDMVNVNETDTVMSSSTADKTMEPQTGSTEDRSEAKESSVQAGESIKPSVDSRDNGGAKKVTGKAPPRGKAPPVAHQHTAEIEASTISEVKRSSVQGKDEDKKPNNADNSAPARRKGRKKKSKTKYSKESNPVDASIEEKRSLTSDSVPPCKGISVKVSEEGTKTKCDRRDGEQKLPSRAGRRSKLPGIKKAIKHPKRRNRFGGCREEETELSPFSDCKKEGIVRSVTEQKVGEQKSSSESSTSVQTVVRRKAKPVTGTEFEDGAKRDDERPSSSEAVLSQCKPTPKIEAADHHGTAGSGGTVSKQVEAAVTESVKTAETDAATEEKEKQELACFFNKLLKPAPQKVSQHYLELSAFVAEERNLLKEEIASLDKVTLKLEREMRQAMDIPDCKEELDGLMQDWLTLNEYRAELATRKNNLQILDKQEDVEQCCNVMRSELKLLFKVQDWRKTARHKAQEARLLDLLLSFVNKRRENC